MTKLTIAALGVSIAFCLFGCAQWKSPSVNPGVALRSSASTNSEEAQIALVVYEYFMTNLLSYCTNFVLFVPLKEEEGIQVLKSKLPGYDWRSLHEAEYSSRKDLLRDKQTKKRGVVITVHAVLVDGDNAEADVTYWDRMYERYELKLLKEKEWRVVTAFAASAE